MSFDYAAHMSASVIPGASDRASNRCRLNALMLAGNSAVVVQRAASRQSARICHDRYAYSAANTLKTTATAAVDLHAVLRIAQLRILW